MLKKCFAVPPNERTLILCYHPTSWGPHYQKAYEKRVSFQIYLSNRFIKLNMVFYWGQLKPVTKNSFLEEWSVALAQKNEAWNCIYCKGFLLLGWNSRHWFKITIIIKRRQQTFSCLKVYQIFVPKFLIVSTKFTSTR